MFDSSRSLIIHINKDDFFLAGIVYLLMFFSNDTYIFGTNHVEAFVAFPRFLMIIICLICTALLIANERINIPIKKMIPWLLMLISFVIVANFNNDNFSRATIKVLCMTSAFLLCLIIPFKKYCKAFVQAMTFIGICSISLTILTYVSPSLVRQLPSVVNTANVRLYTIIVSGIDERSVGGIAAKCGGIFWEGGVYQMYLNLAICYVLFFWEEGKIRNRTLAVLGLALALTFSTTGYIACLWVLAVYSMLEKNDIRKPSKTVMIFPLLLLGIFGLYIVIMYTALGDVVFSKLFDTTHGSTMVREASVIINWELMKEKPLTGWGMEVIPDEFERRSYLSPLIYGWTRQNTNTLLYQFAAHGAVWGALFTIGTYNYCKLFSKKKTVVLGIFIMILMLYIGENLMTSMLPYILIFYGFDYKEERKRMIDPIS